MAVRNTAASVAYKLLTVLAGIFGLLLVSGVFEGRFHLSVLSYFTVLSNILCVVYFAADIVYILKTRRLGKAPVWCPALKGIAMMAITVTLLVAHFILGTRFTMGGSLSLTLLFTHYVVPLMTIADWLLFDPKGLLTWKSPLLWTIGPLVYFVYAMIAARIGDGIGYGGSRYPYPFLDVDVLGFGTVLLWVLGLVVFFVALGYLWVLADKGLGRIAARYINTTEHQPDTGNRL
jgi:hypothetical protein